MEKTYYNQIIRPDRLVFHDGGSGRPDSLTSRVDAVAGTLGVLGVVFGLGYLTGKGCNPPEDCVPTPIVEKVKSTRDEVKDASEGFFVPVDATQR